MAMAEDHAAKLAEASEAPRLGALFAAGRLDGSHQDKLLALQVPRRLTQCHRATRLEAPERASLFRAPGPLCALWLSAPPGWSRCGARELWVRIQGGCGRGHTCA